MCGSSAMIKIVAQSILVPVLFVEKGVSSLINNIVEYYRVLSVWRDFIIFV